MATFTFSTTAMTESARLVTDVILAVVAPKLLIPFSAPEIEALEELRAL